MNIQEMMKQAQVMQKRMEELQARLADTEVKGQSGGGLVEVTMTCRGEVRALSVDASLVNPNDKEAMEDLIMAAMNNARANADATMADETRGLMQSMGLPTDGTLPKF